MGALRLGIMFNLELQHSLTEGVPRGNLLTSVQEDQSGRLLLFDLSTKVAYFTFDEKKKDKIANQIC